MISPLLDSDLDLEPFFRVSHDNLCIAGYDGFFKMVNPAFIKLMGYSQKELLAVPISHFVHPQDKAKTAVTRNLILEDNPLVNFENRYITKSGDIVWLTWTSIPVHDKKLIYAISKNITHIKKLEEERQFLIKDLTTLNSGLKQLIYTISHDLRSPVSNMLSLFSFLDLSKIQDKDTLQDLDLLEQSVNELKDLLNEQMKQLKDILLFKSGLEEVNLNTAFQATKHSIHSLIEDSKATFVIDFSEVEVLIVNNFYMHSIFLNLITNAIKYARPGISPVITVSSKRDTDAFHIFFSDNGMGFDMEKNKNKIFGLNQVFADNGDSKGIGLYLVKNYMNNLEGTIEISSQLNLGTTFQLTFKNHKLQTNVVD